VGRAAHALAQRRGVRAKVLQPHTHLAQMAEQETGLIKVPQTAPQPEPAEAANYARDIRAVGGQKVLHPAPLSLTVAAPAALGCSAKYKLPMWKCPVCSSTVEDDSWTECWRCGSQRSLDAKAVERESAALAAKIEKARSRDCLRCDTPLRFLGTKKFHEGTRQWGFWLSDLGELFVHREHFDVFACPTCGKVEFFVEGLHDGDRPAAEEKTT
jgi:hypothetical protein